MRRSAESSLDKSDRPLPDQSLEGEAVRTPVDGINAEPAQPRPDGPAPKQTASGTASEETIDPESALPEPLSDPNADLYEILGVAKDATVEQIKKAYRRKALMWHPDKNINCKDLAERQFKLIAEAYEVLSDPEKRQIYDKYGREGLATGGAPPPPGGAGANRAGGVFDLFNDLLNRGAAGNHQQGGRRYYNSSIDPNDVFRRFFGSANPFMFMTDDEPPGRYGGKAKMASKINYQDVHRESSNDGFTGKKEDGSSRMSDSMKQSSSPPSFQAMATQDGVMYVNDIAGESLKEGKRRGRSKKSSQASSSDHCAAGQSQDPRVATTWLSDHISEEPTFNNDVYGNDSYDQSSPSVSSSYYGRHGASSSSSSSRSRANQQPAPGNYPHSSAHFPGAFGQRVVVKILPPQSHLYDDERDKMWQSGHQHLPHSSHRGVYECDTCSHHHSHHHCCEDYAADTERQFAGGYQRQYNIPGKK